MNDTPEPERLVLSAIVFVGYPRIGTTSEDENPRVTVCGRPDLSRTAREETEVQMAIPCGRRALHDASPPISDRSYELGDQILV